MRADHTAERLWPSAPTPALACPVPKTSALSDGGKYTTSVPRRDDAVPVTEGAMLRELIWSATASDTIT
jgi:hypothetical protein